jgi:hypothetical protein
MRLRLFNRTQARKAAALPPTFRPTVEDLEGRLTPSSLLSATAANQIFVQTHQTLDLSGNVGGTFTQSESPTQMVQSFNGNGFVSPLGMTHLTGTLHILHNGYTQGTLVLHTSQGTVTISVYSPDQGQGHQGMHTLLYQITGGTGAYQGDTGAGQIQLTESGGHFTLAFMHHT